MAVHILAQATSLADGRWWYQARPFNNTILQLASLLVGLIITLVAARVVGFLLARQSRWLSQRERTRPLGLILSALARPAAMLVIAAGLYLILLLRLVNLQISPERNLTWFWLAVCKTIAALAVGWAMYRLVDVAESYLKKWTSRTRTQLDDQLVPVIRKAMRIFVVIIVLLFIAQNIFVWDIGALLAGLGIGGLAFALAAQDTLKNFFGSVTIFADRPFAMGDLIKMGEHTGFVEEVGFRSTRIRTLAGHLVTIPNSMISDTAVENIGRRPSIRRVLNVTVTYDTPPEKMAQAVNIIREMLQARGDHFEADKPPQVHFSDFNADSLNIVVYYWFTPADWWQYLAFNHDFNMELLRRFNEDGLEFAFPTQTLYLKQDSDFRIAGSPDQLPPPKLKT